MNENKTIGNAATRIRVVRSCAGCPFAQKFTATAVECWARDMIEWLELDQPPVGVAKACPLKGEAVFVALAASEVIR